MTCPYGEIAGFTMASPVIISVIPFNTAIGSSFSSSSPTAISSSFSVAVSLHRHFHRLSSPDVFSFFVSISFFRFLLFLLILLFLRFTLLLLPLHLLFLSIH